MTLFGMEFHRNRRRARRRRRAGRGPGGHFPGEMTLADLCPGRQAKVVGFLPGLSVERRAQLQAYGLVPGSTVRLMQHSPVIIVQVEYLELALERELAFRVKVMPVSG